MYIYVYARTYIAGILISTSAYEGHPIFREGCLQLAWRCCKANMCMCQCQQRQFTKKYSPNLQSTTLATLHTGLADLSIVHPKVAISNLCCQTQCCIGRLRLKPPKARPEQVSKMPQGHGDFAVFSWGLIW